MKYSFNIEAETPSKKNSRIFLRNGRNIPSKRYKEWHEVAQMFLIPQKLKQKLYEPINEPCKIDFCFYHGDKRRRDSDNQVSSILDALQDVGILKDDDWKIVKYMTIGNFEDKNKKGYCTIEITML